MSLRGKNMEKWCGMQNAGGFLTTIREMEIKPIFQLLPSDLLIPQMEVT